MSVMGGGVGGRGGEGGEDGKGGGDLVFRA